MDCIFCKIKDYVLENDQCYGIFDKMPVNEGHMLIILKRHSQYGNHNNADGQKKKKILNIETCRKKHGHYKEYKYHSCSEIRLNDNQTDRKSGKNQNLDECHWLVYLFFVKIYKL